jgi:hypothetical protein
MRCKQVEAQLAEYADGLLEGRQRERVESHLAECRDCLAALADVEVASDALNSLLTVRPPASFAPRIRSAVRAAAPRALAPPLLRWDLRAVLGGAFTVFACLVLATQYVARPRAYVAPVSASRVALAGATAAAPVEQPAAARPVAARPHAAVVHPASAQPRRYRPRLGTERSLSAVTGTAPSREPLAPKPRPGAASDATTPPPPSVSRPSLYMTALADSSVGPRLADETAEIGPRLVALPVAEAPSTPTAPAPLPDPGEVAAGPSAGAAAAGETASPHGFEELFSEDTVT